MPPPKIDAPLNFFFRTWMGHPWYLLVFIHWPWWQTPKHRINNPPRRMKIHIHSWSMSTWYESKSAAERRFFTSTCLKRKKMRWMKKTTKTAFFRCLEQMRWMKKQPAFNGHTTLDTPSHNLGLRCYHPTPRACFKAMWDMNPRENSDITKNTMGKNAMFSDGRCRNVLDDFIYIYLLFAALLMLRKAWTTDFWSEYRLSVTSTVNKTCQERFQMTLLINT